MNIELLQGDCLELMKDIPDKSIDMILADLPYGTTECKWDTLWEQYERVIKDNGAIVLFGSEPFSTMLRSSNFKLFKYDWIWKKNTTTGFQHSKNMPLKNYEIISVFSKGSMGYNYPKMILEYDNEKGLHPTQKPVKLAEYLIKTYTNEGDTVLDNVMGSGTTGVACKNTNRNFIGMELDEEYFKIAQDRIENS